MAETKKRTTVETLKEKIELLKLELTNTERRLNDYRTSNIELKVKLRAVRSVLEMPTL